MIRSRRTAFALAAASICLIGAAFSSVASAADNRVPSYLTDQLATCNQIRVAAPSAHVKAWAQDCIAGVQAAIDKYLADHPDPTPTTPTPTPSRTPTPPGAVTHGSQISPANTGVAAWVGPAGERCTSATVYTARMSATDFPVNTPQGRSLTCVEFRAGLVVDAAITITAGRFTGSAPGGSDAVFAAGARITLNWATIDGAGFNCEIGVSGRVSILRTQVVGCSDGVRFDDTDVVESWIRTRSLGADDHNDGIQAYLASAGGSILRSNIDSRPVNGSAFGTAAVFLADNSHGTAVIRDNLLAGGNGTLRLHEAMTYRVTGNRVVDKSWQSQTGPYSNDAQVAGAVLEWADNTTTAGVPFGP